MSTSALGSVNGKYDGRKRTVSSFSKKASGDMTVSQWKQNRFYPYYPGLEVDVLDVVGIAVSGQTKFKNVRNTYKDE